MIKINKQLFWDVDFKKLDYKKDADFIISRVLFYGDVGDYKLIEKKYGKKKIKEIIKKASYPNKKSLNFWSSIFNIPLESFKCINKSLIKKPNSF
ncbi:MAG: hypothetical protein ABIG88_02165 [Patescibacteria group bacterium]|nr:hypothetical protein [Patescibacteria group bacterium]